MAKEKKRQAKKYVAGMVAATLIGAAGLWTIQTKYGEMKVPAYEAFRVVDGDTFDTTEKQIIRLAGINAPETGDCGGDEAKKQLEKLILGKSLYIKVIYRDKFRRLIGLVYTPEEYVNRKMLELGMGEGDGTDTELSTVASHARDEGRGIFGSNCVQTSNLSQPKCVIKGNVVPDRNLTSDYRFPGCGQYANTLVQLFQGDRWFCTEEEAQAAGFVKGSDCFEKVWK